MAQVWRLSRLSLKQHPANLVTKKGGTHAAHVIAITFRVNYPVIALVLI